MNSYLQGFDYLERFYKQINQNQRAAYSAMMREIRQTVHSSLLQTETAQQIRNLVAITPPPDYMTKTVQSFVRAYKSTDYMSAGNTAALMSKTISSPLMISTQNSIHQIVAAYSNPTARTLNGLNISQQVMKANALGSTLGFVVSTNHPSELSEPLDHTTPIGGNKHEHNSDRSTTVPEGGRRESLVRSGILHDKKKKATKTKSISQREAENNTQSFNIPQERTPLSVDARITIIASLTTILGYFGFTPDYIGQVIVGLLKYFARYMPH